MAKNNSSPPSKHSSSQKYFKLCLSHGLPMKAPHISAMCSRRCLSSCLISLLSSCCKKKSLNVRLGGIESQCVLLYLKASEMMFHSTSINSRHRAASTKRPSSSKMPMSSLKTASEVPVFLQMSIKGFVKVPWIQFGPLLSASIR